MNKLISLLKHPLVVILSAALGGLAGYYDTSFGETARPWGEMYLSALKMSVIPLIFAIISLSVSKFFTQKVKDIHVGKITLTFIAFLVLTSVAGVFSAHMMKPGNIDQEQISDILQATGFTPAKEVGLDEPLGGVSGQNITSFFTDALPNNIFSSLAEGKILQIITFALIFGIAMGIHSRATNSANMSRGLESIQKMLQQIMNTIVTLLPIGIFFLMATQISAVDPHIFNSMIKFVVTAIIMFMSILVLSSIIIWLKSDLGYFRSISALEEAILIVLSTRNSLVGMPSAMEKMKEKLKATPIVIDLATPLGVSLCRYGNTAYFAFITIFISQIYQIPLGANDYLLIVVGCVLAGITTSGVTGILTIPMLALVLDPLGLPLAAVIPLLYAVDPIIDPFRSLSILYTNCAASMWVAGPRKFFAKTSSKMKKTSS